MGIDILARRVAALAVFGAAFAAAAHGQAPDGELQAALRARADPARGEATFEACAVCHRRDGSGRANGSVPRLAGQHATVIVKQVVDIRAGRRINPSMKAIVGDEAFGPQAIADVAAFLERLPRTEQVGRGPGSDLARGKALYERDCVECHGARGEGDAAKFRPVVAAQHYAYLLRELELIRDGRRGNSDPAMVRVIEGYAPEDFKALADHMARMPAPAR